MTQIHADLLAQIDQWGRDQADKAAHISGDRVLTFGELRDRSDALAAWLIEQAPDSRAPVAIQGHKEPEMLVGFLAAAKAGRAYVPIDRATPEARVARMVATAGAMGPLTPSRIADLAGAYAGRRPDPACRVKPEDAFYIMFTSGSTGEPKGVIITLGCLQSFLQWLLDEQQFTPGGETFLNQAPFSFDLSVMDTYPSLVTGGSLFSVSQDDIASPARLYRTLAGSGVTTWVSTPSFARLCLAERTFGEGMLPGLRRFLFCGETLAPEIAAALVERFPQAAVWNTYGPTEATVATTSIRIDRALLERYPALPVGWPKPDGQIVVVDDAGQPVAPGERGEIVIAGPNVSPGYIGRPDLTERAFFLLDGQRAYHTGDWGHYQDGVLFCEGRRDGQLKLHGHRIELGDVEANLQRLPGVQDAVVLPRLRDGRPDLLAAFVVLADRGPGSDFEIAQKLRVLLAERLPAYMVPARFFFLPGLPMTANGKANRQKLAEMLA